MFSFRILASSLLASLTFLALLSMPVEHQIRYAASSSWDSYVNYLRLPPSLDFVSEVDLMAQMSFTFEDWLAGFSLHC